jgi:5-epi-alpha-selinene synthase
MHIPELFCPFPADVHPSASTVDAATIAWAQQFQLVPRNSYHPLQALHIGWLAARTHPQAHVAGVQLVADWCSWLFLHDDFCDESPLATQPEQLRQWHQQLAALMSGDPAPTQAGLIGAFANLWERTCSAPPASPGWVERFRSHIEQFFEAASWEAGHRASGRAPALAEYLQRRPLTSGMDMYIDLIDVVHDFRFAPEIDEHDLLQQARDLTARSACWVNDILSYPKEQRRGDPNNLVIVLAGEYDEPMSSAVRRAVAIHDDDVRYFLDVEAQHTIFPEALHSEVLRYFGVLRSYMRGNYDWTSASARYLAERSAMA